MAYTVIDVGYSQGEFDWESAKGQIDGAIIECGYGSDYDSQDDAQFGRNVSECERLGIPWGAYLYSYASDDGMANSEADHALRLLSGHSPQLPVFIDVEENDLQGFAHRACEVFCQRIQDSGYTAGFYSGRAYANCAGLGNLPWFAWIAEYGSGSCSFDGNLSAWQYTNSGVMGVDTSYFYTLGNSAKPVDYGARSIQLYDPNQTAAQQWIPEHQGDGSVMLRNAACNKYLDIAGANTASGTPVRVYPWNGTDAQKWKIVEINAGYNPASANPFEIVSVLDDSKVLDCVGGGITSGTGIQLFDRNGTQAQRWQIVDQGNGVWIIINSASGLALDVAAAGA